MKRMRRIWKQTRWGQLNCKLERINTIKHVIVITTMRGKNVLWIVKHYTKLFFFSKSRDGKRANQLKTSWAHVHRQLFPVCPCPVERGTDSRKWFFYLAKFSPAIQGQVDAVLPCYLCLNPVSGMHQVCNLYKVLLLFFPGQKSHKFANWATNMRNIECFTLKYLKHT